jgi:hypothetical protein
MIDVLNILIRVGMTIGTTMMLASIFIGIFSGHQSKADEVSHDLYYGAIAVIALAIAGIIFSDLYA